MNNIDVIIYVNKLLDSEQLDSLYEDMMVDTGATVEVCAETLREIVTMVAEENFIEFGDPILNDEQFYMCYVQAMTTIILDGLVERGLVVADMDPDIGENKFKLSSKGNEVAEELNKKGNRK